MRAPRWCKHRPRVENPCDWEEKQPRRNVHGWFEVTDEHTASPEAREERGGGGGTIPCGGGVAAESGQGSLPPRREEVLLGGGSNRKATLPPSLGEILGVTCAGGTGVANLLVRGLQPTCLLWREAKWSEVAAWPHCPEHSCPEKTCNLFTDPFRTRNSFYICLCF